MALPLVLALAFFSISFLAGLVALRLGCLSFRSHHMFSMCISIFLLPLYLSISLSLSEFFCARGRSMRNVFPKLDTQAYLEGCVGF